jgi:hypothetical protein
MRTLVKALQSFDAAYNEKKAKMRVRLKDARTIAFVWMVMISPFIIIPFCFFLMLAPGPIHSPVSAAAVAIIIAFNALFIWNKNS